MMNENLNLRNSSQFGNDKKGIKCEDPKHSSELDADRYCNRCNKVICLECVVDNHGDHFEESKMKLEEYLQKGKIELSNLQTKTDGKVSNCLYSKKINNQSRNCKKEIEDAFNQNEEKLLALQRMIESLLDYNTQIKNKLQVTTDEYFRNLSENENYKKILQELKSLKSFLENWSSIDKMERLNIVRQKVSLEQNFFANMEALNKEMLISNSASCMRNNSFSILDNNSNSQEDWLVYNLNIKEITSKIRNSPIVSEIEGKFSEMKNKLTKVISEIEKKESSVDRVEDNPNPAAREDLNRMPVDDYNTNGSNNIINSNVGLNTFTSAIVNANANVSNIQTNANASNEEIINSSGIKKNMSVSPTSNVNMNAGSSNGSSGQISYYSVTPNQPSKANFSSNSISPINNSNSSENNNSNSKSVSKDDSFSKESNNESASKLSSEYKYFMALRGGNTSYKTDPALIFYDMTKENFVPIKIKIEDSLFVDPRPSFSFPPEQSKYVNLGNSLLLCGGSDSGRQIDNCFLVKVTKGYTVNIINYPKLKMKRERHNIIYLKNMNSILCCGGFYTKSTELSQVGEEWKYLTSMKHERTNATLMYFNSRYVYCIGGYEMSDKNKSGTYLGSCEYLDMRETQNPWTLINLETMSNMNIRLCAMGVVNLTPNRFLLVGGFDGVKYLNDCHEVLIEDNNTKIQIINNPQKQSFGLGKGVLFFHSSFVPVSEDKFVNYDMNCRLYQYDLTKKSFTQINLSQ